MTPVTVREAQPEDAESIAEVARASWADTYRGIFEPAFIAEFLDRNYRAEQLAAAAARAARSEDEHFLVGEREGQVVAYAQFGAGARGPELFRIYAHPDHYGTGAGSALLDELERRLVGRVDAYLLDVHSRNERGRAFYDRRGFVIVGGGATPDCDLTLARRLAPPRPTLPIHTERLRIRALRDDDAVALHAIYGDEQTMRFIGASGRPTADRTGTERVLDFLRRHDALHGFSLWALEERGSDELVGVAGLLWVEGHGPEVEAVYLLQRDEWGRGLATEALRAVLDVGHGELGHRRIVALAYPQNAASVRVMAKAGMQQDGVAEAYGRSMVRYASVR